MQPNEKEYLHFVWVGTDPMQRIPQDFERGLEDAKLNADNFKTIIWTDEGLKNKISGYVAGHRLNDIIEVKEYSCLQQDQIAELATKSVAELLRTDDPVSAPNYGAASDIIRVNALREYGGYYKDWDDVLTEKISVEKPKRVLMSGTDTALGNSGIRVPCKSHQAMTTYLQISNAVLQNNDGKAIKDLRMVPFSSDEDQRWTFITMSMGPCLTQVCASSNSAPKFQDQGCQGCKKQRSPLKNSDDVYIYMMENTLTNEEKSKMQLPGHKVNFGNAWKGATAVDHREIKDPRFTKIQLYAYATEDKIGPETKLYTKLADAIAEVRNEYYANDAYKGKEITSLSLWQEQVSKQSNMYNCRNELELDKHSCKKLLIADLQKEVYIVQKPNSELGEAGYNMTVYDSEEAAVAIKKLYETQQRKLEVRKATVLRDDLKKIPLKDGVYKLPNQSTMEVKRAEVVQKLQLEPSKK